MRALLPADSRYDEGSAGDLAAYGSAPVSMPRSQLRGCPLGSVLEGFAGDCVQRPGEHMLLGGEELEGVLDAGLAGLLP